MTANDVRPTRLAAARRSRRPLPQDRAQGVARRRRHLRRPAAVVAPPTTDRDLVRQALAELADRRGDDDRRRDLARALQVGGKGAGQRREAAARRRSCRALGRRPDAAARDADRRRRGAPRRPACPIYTVALGTPDGVIEEADVGGYTERDPRAGRPTTLQQVARGERRPVHGRDRRRRAEGGLRGARHAARPRAKDARDHRRVRRRGCVPAAGLRRALGASASGGCREALLLVARSSPPPRSGVGARPAPSAGRRVRRAWTSASPSPGPWVGVATGGARRRTVLPAVVPRPRPGDRRPRRRPRRPARGSRSSAMLGSPISPGVTTQRAAVFVARTTRSALGLQTLARLHTGGRRWRPRADVVRAEAEVDRGGAAGRRRDDSPGQERAAEGPADRAALALVPPGRAAARVLDGRCACARGGRRRSAALGSVRATPRRAGRGVVVDVRSRITRPVGTRIEVQIHVICVRGPS